MKRISCLLALVSLSAQAFVCEKQEPKVLKHSDIDMGADIFEGDSPRTIQLKKEYEKHVIDIIGPHKITAQGFTDANELAILEGIIAYKGQADFQSIKGYVKSLEKEDVVKLGIFSGLVQGERADCFELNEPQFQDIVKYVRIYEDKGCKAKERQIYPWQPQDDVQSAAMKVCSSVGGGRADCRYMPMSSCEPSSCR